MFTGGLGNTSFFGLPMIETFYGHEGLATGIVADQLGSFLTLSTLGIITAGLYSTGAPDARAILRKIVLFPPFIALIVALVLIPVDYPVWAVAVLKRLGDTLAPLALVSVGFQLRLGHLAGNGRNLVLGLAFKLLLAPFVLYLLLVGVIGRKRAGGAGDAVRGGNAADDYRRNHCDRARPRSPAGQPDGGGGDHAVFFYAHRMVVGDARNMIFRNRIHDRNRY